MSEQKPFPDLPVSDASDKGLRLHVPSAVVLVALHITSEEHPGFTALQVRDAIVAQAERYPRVKNIATLTEAGVTKELEAYRRTHTRLLIRMGMSSRFAWASRPQESGDE